MPAVPGEGDASGTAYYPKVTVRSPRTRIAPAR